MLTRLLMSAVIAGLVAGCVVAAVQTFTTTPLILEAEAYEGGETAEHMAPIRTASSDARIFLAHMAGGEAHDDGLAAWAPADGFERTFYTSVATIGTGLGFALILLSLMVIAGAPITARSGLAWGTAAFAATGLAPALGLSPELPGSAAAELVARQTWWIGTALATAAGLWLMLRISSPAAIGIGIVLVVVPHLVGAPHPDAFTSEVPSELSGHFASASLVTQALCWVIAGSVAGYVWQRQAPDGRIA